jgi:hypothetical protein
MQTLIVSSLPPSLSPSHLGGIRVRFTMFIRKIMFIISLATYKILFTLCYLGLTDNFDHHSHTSAGVITVLSFSLKAWFTMVSIFMYLIFLLLVAIPDPSSSFDLPINAAEQNLLDARTEPLLVPVELLDSAQDHYTLIVARNASNEFRPSSSANCYNSSCLDANSKMVGMGGGVK